MLDKEADLEKKLAMLQEELRALSELEEDRKTEEDRKREDLLLEELVECVKKRNELVKNIGIKICQYFHCHCLCRWTSRTSRRSKMQQTRPWIRR